MPVETSERPRIYLDKVHLKGFKSIEDLSIDFQRGLNILIGQNGSGKSNFMEFLFETIGINRTNKIFFNYVKLDYSSSDSHSFIMELEKQVNAKNAINTFNYRNGLLERLFIDGELVFDNSSDDLSQKTIDFQNRKIRIVGIGGNLTELFLHWGYQYWYPLYIKFELPDNLQYIDTPGTVKANLENLNGTLEYADTLSFMDYSIRSFESLSSEDIVKIKDITKNDVLAHLKIQDEIIENLKLYTTIKDARFNENINLYNDGKDVIIDNIKLEFKINGNWLPWSQLSDGAKRLFYIIAEVTNSNGLVLIEEPELGIHPHQFNLVMNFLKEQSENKQIIISTHAPKALDRLSPKELNNILVTHYDLKKGTQMRHLKGKEIKTAKRYMNEVGFLSDYWLLSDLEE